MAAKNISNYIKNITKSVSYSVVDRFDKMAPASSEFITTNSELFKEVYSSVVNYKSTFKRSRELFASSKIYEAGSVGFHALMEDITTGKFYNKERDEAISSKIAMGDMGDMSFDESSFNFDDSDISSGWNEENLSDSDRFVVDSIEGSTKASAKMISSTVARTGEYIAETTKTSTNILYNQNAHAYSMFNSNLSAINQNMSNLLQFSTKGVQTHMENSKKYFETTTKLMQEQTGLLQQIAQSVAPIAKKQDTKKERLTIDDIMGVEGTPDLKQYFSNVQKNFMNEFGAMLSGGSMFGKDSNILLTFVSSPLKVIPDFIAKKILPQAIEQSMQTLDQSISGFFGSLISKFNNMSKNDNWLASTIGKIFGVNNNIKGSIDTSLYEKGKVGWTGKDHKSLTEVIPTYLRKILAAVSGKNESVYDYDKGKFVEVSSIKKEMESKRNQNVNRATSDMKSLFTQMANQLFTYNSIDDKKSFDKDMENFFKSLYDQGGFFDINSKDIDYDYQKYGVSPKNFKIIRALFSNAPRHMQHSVNRDILSSRSRENKEMMELEKIGDSIFQNLYNGSNLDEFSGKKKPGAGILEALDNKGHNMFFYLQKMYTELSYMRRFGMGRNTGDLNQSSIITKDGARYDVPGHSIDEITIPNAKKRSDEDIQREREARDARHFIDKQARLREKNKELVNISTIDDEKELEHTISSKVKTYNLTNQLDAERIRRNENPTLIEKLLEADSVSGKVKVVIDRLNDLSKKPAEFISNTIDKVDQRLYEVIYGKRDENGDVKGFMDMLILKMQSTFAKLNSWLDDNILNPLKNKLEIDNLKDLGKRVLGAFGFDPELIAKSIKTYFVGNKDTNERGIFSDIGDSIKKTFTGAFNIVKQSMKDAYSPLFGRAKRYLNGKKKPVNVDSSDDEDTTELTPAQISKLSMVDRVNYITGVTGSNQGSYDERQAAYEDLFNRQDNPLNIYKDRIFNYENSGKLDDYRNSAKNKSELDKMFARITGGKVKSKGKIREYQNLVSQHLDKEKEYKEYERMKKLVGKYNDVNYRNYTRDDYKTKLNNLIGLSDDNNQIPLKLLFENLITTDNQDKYDSVSLGDLLNISRGSEKNDPRYRGISDKVSGYIANVLGGDNKISIADVIKRNVSNVVAPKAKTAEDYVDQFPGLISSNEIGQSCSESVNILQKIYTILKDKVVRYLQAKKGSSLIDDVVSEHADGARYVTKSGITAISKGEMIIPSDMNPFNPDRNKVNRSAEKRNERNIKRKYANSMMDNIMEYADGTKDAGLVADTKKTVFTRGGLVEEAATELKYFGTTVRDALFGKGKDDRKKVDEVLADVMSNISEYAPGVVSSGLLGAGVSLFTGLVGGPLLGAAVGAGMSIINRNEKAQDYLFGKIGKDGEREGGLVSKNLQQTIAKYLPDLKTYGIAGATTGLLLPFGPIGGLLLGSGIAFAKNNEDVQKRLFGEEGLFKEESVDKLKKMMPKVAAGAAVGLFAGPFGILGNAAIGSGVGMLTTSDTFKEAVLGKKNETTGEYEDGILPSLRKYFVEPIKKTMKGFKDGILDFVDKQMLAPLKSAFDPMKKQVELMVKGMFSGITNTLNKIFENTLGVPLKKLVDSFLKPVSFIAGKIFRGFTGVAKFAISSPFKLIGGFGNILRKRQIKSGNATYMSASERNEFRRKHRMGFGDNFAEADSVLEQMAKEDPEMVNNLYNSMDMFVNTEGNLKKQNLSAMSEMGSEVSRHMGYRQSKSLMKKVNDGNFTGAYSYIDKLDLPDNVKNNLKGFLESKSGDFLNLRMKMNDSAVVKNEALQGLYKQKAFKNFTEKDFKAYLGLLNSEKKFGAKSSEVVSNEPVSEVKEEKRHKEIIDIEKKQLELTQELVNILRVTSDRLTVIGNRDGSYISKLDSRMGRKVKKGKNNKYASNLSDYVASNPLVQGSHYDGLDAVPYDNYIANLHKDEMVVPADQANIIRSNIKKNISSSNIIISLLQRIANSTESAADTTKDVVEQTTDTGDVIQYIRDSSGNLRPNFGDSGTREGIKSAAEAKTAQNGIFSKISSFIGGIKDKIVGGVNSVKEKKNSIVDTIGSFMENAGLIAGGLALLPQATEIVKKYVLPIASDLWTNTISPWLQDTALPWVENVLVPKVIDGVAAGAKLLFTDIIPSIGKAIANQLGLSGENGEQSAAEQVGTAVARDTVNGGKVATTISKMTRYGETAADVGMSIFRKGILGNLFQGTAHVASTALSKIGGVVAKPLNYLDKITGLAKKSAAVKDTIETKGVEAVIKSAESGILKQFSDKVGAAIQALASNTIVKKYVGESAGEIGEKLSKRVLGYISENAVELIAKVSAKTAGAVSSLGLINIVWAAADFVTGYRDAKSILGITEEPTLGMKIATAFVKSINGLILFGLIPENLLVDFAIDIILPIFDKDGNALTEMRDKAKAEVQQYNSDNNTSYSVEQYNDSVKSSPGILGNITNGAKNMWNSLKSYVTGGTGGGNPDPRAKFYGMGGEALTRDNIKYQNLTSYNPVTADELNAWFAKKARKDSPFIGRGDVFIKAAQASGLDPRYIAAHAAIESGWGTSNISRKKNNYFGIGAFNSSPMGSAYTFGDGLEAGIVQGAEWIRKKYTDKGQNSLYGMIYGNPKHVYAQYDDGRPNDGWMNNIASIMSSAPGLGELNRAANNLTSANGASGTPSTTTTNGGFTGMLSDFGNLMSNTMTNMYGTNLNDITGLFDNAASGIMSSIFKDTVVSNGDSSASSANGSTPPASGSSMAESWLANSLKGRVTSPFGTRTMNGAQENHKGIDIGTNAGTPIKSTIDGTVVANGFDPKGYGNYLKVKDAKGYIHTFGHMMSPSKLSVGSAVKFGDIIGYVGSTGRSTGPHLHYQVNNGTEAVNPNDYLNQYYKGSMPSSGGPKIQEMDSSNKKSVKKRIGGATEPAVDSTTSQMIKAIIEVLMKIADNTSSITEIVNLLTQAMDVKTSNDSKVKSTAIQDAKSRLQDILKSSNSRNTDNSYLIQAMAALANE